MLAVCIKSVQFSFRFSIELISQVKYRFISYLAYHTSLSYIQVSVSGYIVLETTKGERHVV